VPEEEKRGSGKKEDNRQADGGVREKERDLRDEKRSM